MKRWVSFKKGRLSEPINLNRRVDIKAISTEIQTLLFSWVVCDSADSTE
jgi:hypothetical protein